MAGATRDRFRFPRRDGAAVSHLRRQLENSAERIHRAGAIRRRARLSRARHAHRLELDRAAGKKPEPSIMVEVMERPGRVAAPETTAPIIEIENLGFAYGAHD